MIKLISPFTRRDILRWLTGAAVVGVSVKSTAALLPTPSQAEGPFYPEFNHRFLDSNNDLVKLDQETKEAGGQFLYLVGTVLTPSGIPVANARVEIWQCDVNGRYIHPHDASSGSKKDNYFQGFGKAFTNHLGQYNFRTIKPVAYGSRTPHIHFKVFDGDDRERLTTQLYFRNESLNEWDSLYRRLSDEEKNRVTVRLDEIKDQALLAQFDITIAT